MILPVKLFVEALYDRLRGDSVDRDIVLDESPLRSGLFSSAQMIHHGRTLAGLHQVANERDSKTLLSRLNENEAALIRTHAILTAAVTANRLITPAGEWLLDNFYLIEEQVRTARRHLPKSYHRELPLLTNTVPHGLPRVYDIALEIIAHGDGRIDPEILSSFVMAYQEVVPLKLGELWAIPIMLRLALIENLRRVASRIATVRNDQELADSWADQMAVIMEGDPKSLILVVADMARSSPPKSSAFVAELTRRLQGQSPSLVLPLTWIKQWLGESGLTIEHLVHVGNQHQAADQVSISNSIGSLRLLGAIDWQAFVERMSVVEKALYNDPSGIYPLMGFATRDRYRHVIESIAKSAGLSEVQVAVKAIDLAAVSAGQAGEDRRNIHVGYYLIDRGRPLLEEAIGARLTMQAQWKKMATYYALPLYLGAIFLGTAVVTYCVLMLPGVTGMSLWEVIVLAFFLGLAVSQMVLELVNIVAMSIVSPQALPRMDFIKGIPTEFKTLTVVPTLITSPSNIGRLIEALEVRFLANRDKNLLFGLLTDFSDAATETLPSDDALVLLAKEKIEALNQKYSVGREDIFFLFHRPRQWNAQEGIWMGYERKRGKLADLNWLLRGGPVKNFSCIVGNITLLRGVKYIITLDTDTQLPRDCARELVAVMAHPLNKAFYNPAKGCVTHGYGILQPRVSMSLSGANRSYYARLYGGEQGIDPYTRTVSDVYQDIFGEGSFIGKGIYDVDIFERALKGRFPQGQILSHDLWEGCYARCGLLSDVELFEEHPYRYSEDVKRRHRWIRGDWQLIGWLWSNVPASGGRKLKNTLSILSQWKLFDNLRRSGVPVALMIVLLMGWTVLSNSWSWTAVVVGIIVFPSIVASCAEVVYKSKSVLLEQHLRNVAQSIYWRFSQRLFTLACLPYEAYISIDAIARTGVRMLITHKRLLEWNVSSDKVSNKGDLFESFRLMWIAPAVAVISAIYLLVVQPYALPLAGLMVLLWGASPMIAWTISTLTVRKQAGLSEEQNLFLRLLARRTWDFFDTFVGPEDHWLPPDNFQENRAIKIAHRTSPTNIGLALLANVSAYDFGYITSATLIERTHNTFKTMQQLKRHRGHFFNWYDTITLNPLMPRYISTVDSGNLAGHLMTLRSGLNGLWDDPILSRRTFEGLKDTLAVIVDAMENVNGHSINVIHQELTRACALMPMTAGAACQSLEALNRYSRTLIDQISVTSEVEATQWAQIFERQCGAALKDLTSFVGDQESQGMQIPTLRQLAVQPGAVGACAQARIAAIENLTTQANTFLEMEYGFLYDPMRHLLSVGYHVEDRKLDPSFYDLLASEARLCYFTAIALGQIPQESWFSLGRLLTSMDKKSVLLSWSGSMFEYLMPMLVMPTYENSLLEQTCHAAVERQIEYGQQHRVAWGISESGYNTIDAALNYQYRAFGVPGLGLKRGLSEDLVIAPYASVLALMVEPLPACHNLLRLGEEGVMGKYGFYEAIDYTAVRQRPGQTRTILRSYMAHHQGMSILSLAYLLLDRPMQKRFMADPLFQATLLLLQEKVPNIVPYHVHVNELANIHTLSGDAQMPVRVLTSPDTVIPEVQLLSNGRYHVMITNAGGGYSRFNDIDVTRWREDSTRDHWGFFCYIRDLENGNFWSNAHQPTLQTAEFYEAIFSEGRAEFKRRDDGIETHTEIVVSPEDDIELRRVTITNRSRTARMMDVTSYAEVVLATQAADALHPMFSDLFVQTQLIPERHAILCSRRPRSSKENPPWMFHLMTVHGADSGEAVYETDRMQFIGRGHSLADPRVMKKSGLLSGSQGSVLDPVVSIQRKICLDPEQTIVIDMVVGIGETQAAAMALIDKYQDRRIADRVFELSWTHSQVVLRQINATETDAQLYSHLANSILYAHAGLRADASVLVQNRRGQSGLWGYAISGDLPIVILQIGNPEHIDLVRQMVQAHAYWRLKGLPVDLVIWNEALSGYQQLLQEQIMGLISASVQGKIARNSGEIFVRPAEQISNEERILLQTVARVIISDRRGTLASQVNRRNVPEIPVAHLVPVKLPRRVILRESQASLEKLDFFNDIGGFSLDGQEYVIRLKGGEVTPLPWVNVLANAHFGTIVSENGMAYTWHENAHEYRLTPWNNDPVNDLQGEAFYIRDEASGRFWSPSPKPIVSDTTYVCRHGFGYSIFEHEQEGIQTQMTVFVPVDASVKCMILKIKNVSGRARRLSTAGYVEWVLGDMTSKTAMHISTEIDPQNGAVFARNPYNAEFFKSISFFAVDDLSRTVTGDRTEFLGRNGSMANPAALSRTHLSGKVGAALDPCAAIHVAFDLAQDNEREMIFTLGVGQNIEDVRRLVHRFGRSAGAHEALQAVHAHWKQTLGAVQVETPDNALNILANGWLLYQTIACRLWARSGFYQSGGAFGFRDQLQDVMALVHSNPSLMREHILRAAAHQFQEGDVQHWWHPPSGRGVRTHCSDDYLWLVFVTCHYIDRVGDKGILDESIPYIRGRKLDQGEDSFYDSPYESLEKGSLYDHCKRALLKALDIGEHGLPLMGSCDWNDGMNLVGLHGKGESIWLGFFLYDVLMQFSTIAGAYQDTQFAQVCATHAALLQAHIEKNGWDGQWYRRAYFDNGAPLGSATNTECQIDSIAQSWAVLSKAGDPMRARMAMDSLNARLVKHDSRIVVLLDPPFDQSILDPGYIKGYVPGVRENGGQYTHAAIWVAMAYATLGDNVHAWEVFNMINPINHALTQTDALIYKVEPYVVAADVYAVNPHVGRGGWTWYTGSAGWMYQLIIESLLGLKRNGDTITISPCSPADWRAFKIHYRYGTTVYHFNILSNPGIGLRSKTIPLVDDGGEHYMDVTFDG